MSIERELKQSARISVLDLLRSLAITFVVITHYKFSYLPGGSVGVSIFFCLSGFLITRNLLEDHVSAADFWLRRIFRIYPTFVIACALNLSLLYLMDSSKFVHLTRSLPELLLFIKMPEPRINMEAGVLWTLQIELLFYFFAPFLIKKVDPTFRYCIVAFLIIVSISIKVFTQLGYFHLPSYSIFQMLFWMDNLLFGVCVALLLNKISLAYEDDLRPKRKIILCNYAALVTIFAIAYFIPSKDPIWPWQSTAVSLLTGIIIFTCLKYQLLPRIPKLVSYISLFAYAIYLAHPFPRELHIDTPIPLVTNVLILASVVALALALHYAVERPGIRLGKRVSAILSTTPTLTFDGQMKRSTTI
jgi:peptidoglycan/LPS O-acetylase OafA/YrhL